MDLFELNGRVVVDLADAVKAFNTVSQEGQKAQSKLGGIFSKVGKGAAVAGKAIGAGLVAGGAAMGTLTIQALNLSGELEQNMGGSEAVFGNFAREMQDTATRAFANMGLSTSDYLATANKMGALFQGAGFDIQESMTLSQNAMQRAADIASIMGIDTASAMEAIAGAAKGNFTMMDNLGVAMNATTIEAYALSKGCKTAYKDMDNQTKIAYAMEMFMEKTTYATGNYAKENETLAGSLGTAKSALTNFLDGSGNVDQLVGAFSNAANVIVSNITEIAPRLVSGLTQIISSITPMIGPLISQLLPSVVDGAVNLINGLVAAMPALVTALVAVLPALITGVTNIINGLIAALPAMIQTLVAALPTLIPELITGITSMITTLAASLPSICQSLVDALPTIITSIVGGLTANLPALIEGATALVVGLVAALPSIIISLIEAIPGIIAMVRNGLFAALPTLISSVGTIITTCVAAIWEFLADLPGALVTYFSDTMGSIGDTISGVWDTICATIATVIETISTTIQTAWVGIFTVVTNLTNAISSTIAGVWSSIATAASTAWNAVKTAIQTPIESARDLVSAAINAIKGFFSFEFTWPTLKLPHFSFTGSWNPFDWPDQFPSIGVEWYAKAMDNPMLMNDPTIFGYNPATGNLMGGGEAGTEVVAGADALMRMIHNVVAANNAAHTDRIIAVLTAILEAITGGNEEMIRALLSGQTIVMDNREFARAVRSYA